MIRLERSDARIVKWMFSVRPEDRISAKELKTRLKLNDMMKCMQDGILQWFGHLERMEDNAWSSKREPSRLVVVSI